MGHVSPAAGQRGHKAVEDDARKKLTILVAEDHSSLRDILSLYLMRRGYHVRTANDGPSALSLLESEEVHLMLLDLMLPRIDGFEVLRRVRQSRGHGLPYVIAVSARTTELDRKKVFELGGDEHVSKPFQLADLLERVRAVEDLLGRDHTPKP